MASLPSPPEWDLLLSAAQKNRPDLIRAMVTEDGVNPSHANGVGQSALHVAALWGHVEAVEALLNVGANAQARNSLTGATPLHMVITSHKGTLENKIKVVDLLLQHAGGGGTASLATMTDQYGRLPIDYLSTQINDNGNTNNGGGIVALSAEQEAFVAAITEKLQPVEPPLLVAIDSSANVQKVQELLSTDDNDTTTTTTLQELVNVSFRNETPVGKTVQLLVSAAEVAATSATTGLEDSSSCNNMRQLVEILTLILQAGGNPNMPTTELSAASSSSLSTGGEVVDPPLVQVLQALGQAYRRREQQQQQQQEKEETNSTAAAATTTSSIIITALQEAAVSLRMAGGVLTTNQVSEFLHASARGALGGLQMVQFLLQDLYLNPNATNRQGMTPLQFAARSGRVEIVQYLLSLNNKNSSNSNNNSSLLPNNNTAEDDSNNRGAVVAVNVHHQDNAGQTALDAARKNNKEQVVKILEEYMQQAAAAAAAHDEGGDQK